jgi:transposase
MKNTARDCQAAGGAKPQRASTGNIYLIKKETKVSLKLTIMLLMKKYNRLTSEQRYAIYLGLKDGTSKKDIALLIGVHISTLYRELERNDKLILGQDTPSPHQVRTKAAPSSLHACIRLASFSHEVRSVSAAVSRFKYGKEAGLFYTGLTESDVVIPALKRRKSEGRAKDNQ